MQNVTRVSSGKLIPWVIFIAYVGLSGYTIAHHEMWGDEIHSWNIAKASASYPDLIHNTRYEGHPPVWYTILWTISKFTHHLAYVQAVHWFIACATVFLIIFLSPMPLLARCMIPFGYFFLYEYSVLSRNYAIGILLACCICLVIRKRLPATVLLYYSLLFLMSNTHLLGVVLAGCLHLYFILFVFEQKRTLKPVVPHLIAGVLIFIPALYFIFPPSDSQLNTGYWISRWNPEQIKALGQAPLRSFVPFPAWWEEHFWNTQFLLDSTNKSIFLNFLVALGALSIAVLTLYRNWKALTLFLANVAISFLLALVVFPLTSARYAGFLFIGFIIAYWLYCYETSVTRRNQIPVNGLLLIHVLTGFFMTWKDIRLPFSNAGLVNELLQVSPANSTTVTDYWAMNTISAFADRPIYCVDIQREISFVIWGPELGYALTKPNRYTEGINNLLNKEEINKVYMISTGSPEALKHADHSLFTRFHVQVIDAREGADEKGGNLYLYEISKVAD